MKSTVVPHIFDCQPDWYVQGLHVYFCTPAPPTGFIWEIIKKLYIQKFSIFPESSEFIIKYAKSIQQMSNVDRLAVF